MSRYTGPRARVSRRFGVNIFGTKGETVALDLELTQELVRAGLLREVIRLVQEQRKSSGLEVSDRIALTWTADGELAQKIMDNMFVFDDLEKIDDKGFQALLKEVQSDQLVLALKAASPELREKVFRNMSSRAAEMHRVPELVEMGMGNLIDAACDVELHEVRKINSLIDLYGKPVIVASDTVLLAYGATPNAAIREMERLGVYAYSSPHNAAHTLENMAERYEYLNNIPRK